MQKKYIGVIPPVVTPLDEHENVDEAGFRQFLAHCVDAGMHGIFVAGSNGECLALTQRERNRAIKIALDEIGTRVPVLAGVMDSSTRRVVENIKALEQMGGGAAVITPVFYARHSSQDETVRHFEKISRATNIDLLVYNIPRFTGQTLKPGTIAQILAIDKVVGCKDTSGSLETMQTLLASFRGSNRTLHQGLTSLAAASLLAGADGYIPTLAPLFPKVFLGLYQAGRSGDVGRAFRLQQVVEEVSGIFSMTADQTASCKFALSTLGYFHERVAAPTQEIRPEERSRILAKIEHLRAVVDNLN